MTKKQKKLFYEYTVFTSKMKVAMKNVRTVPQERQSIMVVGKNIKLIQVAFAGLVTVSAISMAGISAWSRGGTNVEKVLLVSISICICLGAHLILAMSKAKVAWVLWSGCLCCAIYSHVNFFSAASLHVAVSRAQQSIQDAGLVDQIEERRKALVEIKARPVSEVADDLAATSDVRKRAALRLELAEARRAVLLRDQLIHLSDSVTTAKQSYSIDPVASLLSRVTNGNGVTLELMIWLGISVLVELLGVFLWNEIMNPVVPAPPIRRDHSSAIGEIDRLRLAVTSGDCKPTVAGIRSYLGCGQDRAMLFKRRLFAD